MLPLGLAMLEIYHILKARQASDRDGWIKSNKFEEPFQESYHLK